MGFILFGFSLLTLLYSLLPVEDEIEIEEAFLSEFEEERLPPLNPYTVAAAFTVVGAACVAFAWRKKSAETHHHR